MNPQDNVLPAPFDNNLTYAVSTHLSQMSEMIANTREMAQKVDNALDAAALVRRACATETMLDQVLRACHVLEEEQFTLRQEAAEVHLRTQRRAGRLLGQLSKNRGGRPRQNGSHADRNGGHAESSRPAPDADGGAVATLQQLGIERHESHRWQQIAALPTPVFESYIAEMRERRKELTTSGVLALARRLRRGGDESIDGFDRPSSGAAVLPQYEQAKRCMYEMIWLDPVSLARTMDRPRRQEEVNHIHRVRLWLDEFEQALVRLSVDRS